MWLLLLLLLWLSPCRRYNNVINEMLAAGIEPVATVCESVSCRNSSLA